MTEQCIHHLIAAQAKRTPDAIAIAAPKRAPLTYSRLHIHINNVVETLNASGVGRNDRVATVLPNGPEMAVAFLAVASGATSAPLNPAYGTDEFDFRSSYVVLYNVLTTTRVIFCSATLPSRGPTFA